MASTPFGNRPRPPSYYEGLLNLLRHFREIYVTYINEVVDAVYAGDPIENSPQRSRVLELGTLAEAAIAVAGLTPPAVHRPSISPGPPAIGLLAVAIAHEDPVFRRGAGPLVSEPRRQPYELAIDTVEVAIARIQELLDAERRRRRKLTYWIDRGLRSVLGLPAYLISLLLGFDRYSLPPSQARALWVVSVIIETAAAVVTSGSVFDWWG